MLGEPDSDRCDDEDQKLSEAELEAIERQADWARRNLGEQEWAGLARRVLFAERSINLSLVATVVGLLYSLVGGLYFAARWGLDRLQRDPAGATDSLTSGPTPWHVFLFPALLLGLAAVSLLLGLAMRRASGRRWRSRVGSGPDADEGLSSAYFVILDRARKAYLIEEAAEQQAADQSEARRETEVRTRSWLATELDGAHLVWWISFVVLISDWLLGGALPEPVAPVVWVVAAMGIVLKVAILPILVVCSWMWPHAQHLNPRLYYRTLGDGWQYMIIALAPALVALVFHLELYLHPE